MIKGKELLNNVPSFVKNAWFFEAHSKFYSSALVNSILDLPFIDIHNFVEGTINLPNSELGRNFWKQVSNSDYLDAKKIFDSKKDIEYETYF